MGRSGFIAKERSEAGQSVFFNSDPYQDGEFPDHQDIYLRQPRSISTMGEQAALYANCLGGGSWRWRWRRGRGKRKIEMQAVFRAIQYLRINLT